MQRRLLGLDFSVQHSSHWHANKILIRIDHELYTDPIGLTAMNEQREHTRICINHPLVYTAVDSQSGQKSQGMAVSIDISQFGMMIESAVPIYANTIKVSTATGQCASVEATAEIIYCLPHAPNKFRTGLKFSGPADQRLRFADELINQGQHKATQPE